MKKKYLIAAAVVLGAGIALYRSRLRSEHDLHTSLHQKERQPFRRKHAGSDMCFYPASAAKQLGRTVYHPDTKTLWCSLSGSGIAFSFCGKECILHLTADSAYTGGKSCAARYAVFLNGKLAADAQLTEPEQTVRLHNTGNSDHPADVRFVKLSESQHSSLGIREICIVSSGRGHRKCPDVLLTAAENKPHCIEFIGDSITCGYGVEGSPSDGSFRTETENVMKSYAYLTAERLRADYSMVCYSGHGIISGYTTNGTAVRNQLVPRFYGEVGHCPAVLEGRRRIQDDLWHFARKPDLIVLNLGTNDSSYTCTDPAKQKAFAAAYTAFLKTVREKNPDAPVLCTLGIMGQTLCSAVAQAAADYIAETGDTNIRTMRFAEQSEEDGYAVDWHPSAASHRKAAEQLTAYIQEWLGW